MIIKSLSRKSGTKQILNYLFKNKEKLSNAKFKPLVLRHNVRARTVDKIAKEFEKNEALRKIQRSTNVKAYHTIISFGKDDKEKITEPMLRDFAKKYIELQGKDAMYVFTHHVEKEHIHLHCVMSGSKYMTGIANRLSKSNFGKLKVAMQTYQKEKYPELTKSLPAHGKGIQKGYSKDTRLTQKNTLEVDLKQAYQQSKSTLEFLEQIKSMGHEPYYRNEKLAGIKYDGDRKFRLGRLGYDDDKMKKLEERDEEEKQLNELDDLRNSTDEKEKESESRDRDLDEENRFDEEMDDEDEQEDDYSR